MEAAKNAINKFTSKHGHHDTEVHEQVAAPVEHNTQIKTQHEEATVAVDKEHHIDHHHVSVQPVKDQQVLPEQHHHQTAPVEHKHIEHGDGNSVKQKVAEEIGKFEHKHEHVEGARTTSVAPTVTGEHVHHHVHETIQPVIQREIHEPHVIHTVKPVHEEHHHTMGYKTKELPPVSMDEFQAKSGSAIGGGERVTKFEGDPAYNKGSILSQN